MKKSFFIAMVLVLIAFLVVACTKTEPIPALTPSPTLTPPALIGMKFGERYHEIHTTELQLKCDFCHTNITETYYDPLAQVSNLADRRACLSCHKEGAEQPFYGANWTEAKVR
ncbi:MAG: hypothetical protein HYU83_04685 [Chloroflexi bacterium]|nr:hypothetical protein [Chloroflexota bacterium]